MSLFPQSRFPCAVQGCHRHASLTAGKPFTLVELLVILAIIAVLAALLFPALTRAKETARRASCLSQQRQINIGALVFAGDHNGYLPVRSEHDGMWWTGTGWEAWWDSVNNVNGPLQFSIYGLERRDWIISSLWPVNSFGEPGGSYLTDKSLMRCPSRRDHYQTSNPWDMLIAKQKWNDFWSCYQAIGLSGFLHHAGWYGWHNPLYLIRAEKHDPAQALFTDAVGRWDRGYEYGGDWDILHQTNHWAGNPGGGNVIYADGTGRWRPFSTQAWVGGQNCGSAPAGSWTVWGALWGGPSAAQRDYFFGGDISGFYSGNNTAVSGNRGKFYMPPFAM